MLAFIWAEAHNHVIGSKGELPWHLPDDLQFFKRQTSQHQILAGARTYASFKRPLPNRKNLVLTHRNATEFPAEVLVFSTLSEFLQYANEFKNDLIFVVGGSIIFKQLLPYTQFLYRTTIDATVPGDTYMIPINYDDFVRQEVIAGAHNEQFPHQFEIFARKTVAKGSPDANKFL
ncbi:Dihydrofolate reductase [Fructilactobacillus florum 8D]|uniref:dihydrofolate reductase n=1 Tax=Fructilactobacillus florum 8D TaxID=1221538 RepID=W9EH55_9LACO|nr:dihydrofolate reductase [Fructilactobacillus florum]EKK21149.1 Dihydrofolate reductase [Fructilactobacillus florum 2F]ETO40596.1 Dihydrofolate reductase [Fructilactobacillus florum 8D]